MKKRFDAVEFMRKRRREIDEEDALLTWKERSAKTRKTLERDPLWQRLCGGKPRNPGRSRGKIKGNIGDTMRDSG